MVAKQEYSRYKARVKGIGGICRGVELNGKSTLIAFESTTSSMAEKDVESNLE